MQVYKRDLDRKSSVLFAMKGESPGATSSNDASRLSTCTVDERPQVRTRSSSLPSLPIGSETGTPVVPSEQELRIKVDNANAKGKSSSRSILHRASGRIATPRAKTRTQANGSEVR